MVDYLVEFAVLAFVDQLDKCFDDMFTSPSPSTMPAARPRRTIRLHNTMAPADAPEIPAPAARVSSSPAWTRPDSTVRRLAGDPPGRTTSETSSAITSKLQFLGVHFAAADGELMPALRTDHTGHDKPSRSCAIEPKACGRSA